MNFKKIANFKNLVRESLRSKIRPVMEELFNFFVTLNEKNLGLNKTYLMIP